MILYNILIQEYCSSIATAFFFSVFEGGYEPKKKQSPQNPCQTLLYVLGFCK